MKSADRGETYFWQQILSFFLFFAYSDSLFVYDIYSEELGCEASFIYCILISSFLRFNLFLINITVKEKLIHKVV